MYLNISNLCILLDTKKVKLFKEAAERKKKNLKKLREEQEKVFTKTIQTDNTYKEIFECLHNEPSDFKVALVMTQYFIEKSVYAFFGILKTYGRDQVEKWLKETLDIEKDGGIATKSFSRRRTPGGVFFYLVSRDTKV